MKLITKLFEHYLSQEYENFTSKLISALGFVELVKFTAQDEAELYWIEKNTHKNIMVSFYKLDRVVNPTKGDFKALPNKRKFIRNDSERMEALEQETMIELSEDQIQHHLCNAIRRVHQIICRNIRPYDEDFPLLEDEEGQEDIDEFSSIIGLNVKEDNDGKRYKTAKSIIP